MRKVAPGPLYFACLIFSRKTLVGIGFTLQSFHQKTAGWVGGLAILSRRRLTFMSGKLKSSNCKFENGA